jgi:A118 family predicted phage portal protein
LFEKLITSIRRAVKRLISYSDITTAERVDSALSTEMIKALERWYDLYTGSPPWLKSDTVRSLNLPAFISGEIARQIVLEVKWNITGADTDGGTTDSKGEAIMNPRAQFLKDEFEKLTYVLRQKLEQGCAAGGMVIKPYPRDGHIYFDWNMDWSFCPVAFDDDGMLSDVIFRDSYTEGKFTFTRLERHTVDGANVHVTQRVFKSNVRDSLGVEVSLSEVPIWAGLTPEATITDAGGQLFGWYRVAAANTVDTESPMGASVFSKAEDLIRQADEQYSRLLWEFEGSELAVDVDPSVLRPRTNGKGMESPRLSERLFRGVDLDSDESYHVFSPAIRDESLLRGLNQLLIRIEDQCGLSRGTLSDANSEARTATELRIIRQRTYATIADNQRALEQCLRDVLRAMDKYATLYNLAPPGAWDVSFEWDDSVLTDAGQQLQERMLLLNSGIYGKAEFRQWYFGETSAQAKAAVEAVQLEQLGASALNALLPSLDDQEDDQNTGQT